MAPITDLTFDQLNNAYQGEGEPFFVGQDLAGNLTVLLSVALLNGTTSATLTENGVVKLMVKLRELCRGGQERVNQSQLPDEFLDAFPASSISGNLVDGGILQTGLIKSRIITASATQIEGATT